MKEQQTTTSSPEGAQTDGPNTIGEEWALADLENQFNTTEGSQERPELSPTGSRVKQAADRINNMLESRAINKAHSEALAENKSRDYVAQDAAFASYEENVTYSKDYNTALKANEHIDAKAARAEKLESAKDKVRGIGRSALNSFKRHAKNAMNGSENVMGKVGQRLENGMESAIALPGALKEARGNHKLEAARNKQTAQDKRATRRLEKSRANQDKIDTRAAEKQAKIEQKRTEAQQRRAESEARRRNRREQFANAKDRLTDAPKGAGRAIGRASVRTYKASKRATGRTAAAVAAAGRAGHSTWTTY